MLALVVAGAGLRLWILLGPMRALEGDEAVIGLMARAVTEGRFDTFYWGQAYGGSAEAILTAVAVAIRPTTTTGIKLVSIALNAGAALLLWRIGIRLVGRRTGALAAALFWAWPASFVWLSTDVKGFYQSVIVCGLSAVLLALQVVERPRSWWRWAALGAAAGVGWWQAPQIVLLLVPVVAWLGWSAPRWLRPLGAGGMAAALALGTGGFVVGAAPWLIYNVRNDLLSLDARWAAGQGSYLEHLETFFGRGLPMAFGARVLLTERWLGGVWGQVGFGVVVVVVGGLLVWRRPRTWADPIVLVLAALASYPLVLAAFPNAWYVGEGRYLYFLAPWVALALGMVARWPAAAGAVTAVAILSSASSLWIARHDGRPITKGGVRMPIEVGGAIDVLTDDGYTAAYADYWLAYRLRYQSDDAILGVPTYVSRDPAGEAAVASMDRVGWVLAAGGTDLAPVLCTFDALGVEHRRVDLDDLIVLLPERPVSVADVRATCPAPGIY